MPLWSKRPQTAKAEAEQARKDYEAERDRASQEMAAAEELATQIEATQASLQQEVDRISAEAAELQAQEEAAAEEARRAAEAAEAARQQAEQQAQQMAQQNASAGSGSSGNAAATTPSAESSGGSSAGSSTSTSLGAFTHPCPSATVSSNFGYRTFDNSFHKGVDFAAAEGTPYYAAESGTVIIAGFSESAGNWIVISHGNGLITKYMHSSAIFVSAGQQVTRGAAYRQRRQHGPVVRCPSALPGGGQRRVLVGHGGGSVPVSLKLAAEPMATLREDAITCSSLDGALPANVRSYEGATAHAAHAGSCAEPRALVTGVVPESPADDAGFTPGCWVLTVDGRPLRDSIDWMWYGSDDELEIGYEDTEGDRGTVVLYRDEGEDWGFEFDGALYDGIRLCRNALHVLFHAPAPRRGARYAGAAR